MGMTDIMLSVIPIFVISVSLSSQADKDAQRQVLAI